MATALTEVALAACGALTALGQGVPRLDSALEANTSALRPEPNFENAGYMTTRAGWIPPEALTALREADPAHADTTTFLLGRAALCEAEKHWPEGLRRVPPDRRALVLSTTKGEIRALERVARAESLSAIAHRHLLPPLLARDLADAHHIAGPVQCVSAACISGLLALQQGALLIQRGLADLACVVGLDCLTHFVLAGFTTLKSLDPAGCRPFDRARAGLSLGEGAGAVILARREAVAGSALVVRGWGTSNDANHLTGPSRDGSGLTLAICRALAKAEVTADSVDYVNAHGTGTIFNDAMESLALRAVFGERVPPFSSVKGMLGHTLGAAGVLETIVCARAARNRLLPGTPRLNEPDSAAPPSLLREPRSGALRRILKVNCGFGGTNAAVLLEWRDA